MYDNRINKDGYWFNLNNIIIVLKGDKGGCPLVMGHIGAEFLKCLPDVSSIVWVILVG